MKYYRKLIGLCLGLLIAISPTLTWSATVIYEDLSPSGTWTLPSLNGELGNTIIVAGTERLVTRLSIEIYSQGGFYPNGKPGYADFKAQFYGNDGSDGQPGSLLWQSSVTHVDYPGGLTFLNFDVPQVLVPDLFTWTLQYSNTSPAPPALLGANDPTIGSADGSFWFRGPDFPWVQAIGGGNFVAQIEAVPEPSTIAMLLITTLGGLVLWRRWRQSL